MNEELLELINKFKNDKRLPILNEAAIKQTVVLRILEALGWNPFDIDEVYPEYSVEEKRVDYALRHNSENKVFIEAKNGNEDLEKHQEQLLNYSFREGIKLAILTNGISWWFYLPLHEGSWEQRKFYTIDIYDQDSEHITEKFEEFLLKENVISNRAVETAEHLVKSREKQKLIEITMPKAWEKIVTEPDELFVELLAETVEKLCGYKPANEMVEEFLLKIPPASTQQTSNGRPSHEGLLAGGNSYSTPESYTGKSVVAFTFMGTRYPVRSWREMLIKMTELILSNHREQFDRVLNLKGRKRPYFSRDPNELRKPKRIDDTDIYVETDRSTKGIVRLSKKIIALFGYEENDVSFEIK